MTIAIASSIACGVFLAGLLVAEKSGSLPMRYVTKPLASLGFILVCALGADLESSYALWILIGLIFGAGGDVALMFKSDRAFLAGLVSFLIGHVAYVVAFGVALAPSAWLTPAAIVPVLGAVIVGRWLWPNLGDMKIPVAVYITVITAMAIGGLALVTSGTDPIFDRTHATLATVGAIAFFASDIAVARERFISAGFVNRAWGLPAYYGGQLLLAWSTVPYL